MKYLKKIKHLPYILFLFSILFFGSCSTKNQLSEEFNWLIGTWQFQNKDSTVFEQWWLENDTLLMAENFQLKGQQKITKESIKIYIEGEYFVYETLVYGQNDDKAIPFKMKIDQNNAYLFENKNHDFPQYILYKKSSANHMMVVIGGKVNGKRYTYTYKAIRTKP